MLQSELWALERELLNPNKTRLEQKNYFHRGGEKNMQHHLSSSCCGGNKETDSHSFPFFSPQWLHLCTHWEAVKNKIKSMDSSSGFIFSAFVSTMLARGELLTLLCPAYVMRKG